MSPSRCFPKHRGRAGVVSTGPRGPRPTCRSPVASFDGRPERLVLGLPPPRSPCRGCSGRKESAIKILVTAASKYGATEEIASALAAVLSERGLEVDELPIEVAATVDEYEAVVAGSAVYAGRWMKTARGFIERNAAQLSARPVWLFSSGPIGDPPKPSEDPVDVSSLIELAGARDHRVFAGRLDRGRLSFGERAIATALRAPDGDFRDWDDVRTWASGIADALGERDA